MDAEIRRASSVQEFHTPEGCWIIEVANDAGDPALSISRARVPPGVTTEWHRLIGTEERYIIASGSGRVEVDGLPSSTVGPGDVVRIPADAAQRITNIGDVDLASCRSTLGKVIRAMGVKEFAAKVHMASPNVLRAINPRHNPTQDTLNRLLKPFKLRLSLAPLAGKPRRTAV